MISPKKIAPGHHEPGYKHYSIEWHLGNWADWIMNDYHERCKHGSFASRAHIGTGYGSREFEAMVRDVDVRCARAVDAIVDELPIPQHLAVYHKHVGHGHQKLPAVFRLRASLETSYEDAKKSIDKKLREWGIE